MTKEINNIRRNRKALVSARNYLDTLTRNNDFFLCLYKADAKIANSVEDDTTVTVKDSHDPTIIYEEGILIHDYAQNGWNYNNTAEFDADNNVLVIYIN